MHWGFYVLFTILGLLILLLLTRVKLGFSYREQIGLWIGFGPLRMTLLPSARRKKTSQKKEKPKKAETQEKIANQTAKLQMLLDYAKLALNELGKSARAFRIDDLMLHVVIGSEDAASTALSYGTMSAAMSSFYPLLISKVRIKKQDIRLDADFSGNASLELRLTISAMVILMMFGGLRVLRAFIKQRKIQEIKTSQERR